MCIKFTVRHFTYLGELFESTQINEIMSEQYRN